jgi:putative membrane protein
MTVRWFIASLHLLALVIGAVAIFTRGRALQGVRDATGLPPVFAADNWWGVSGVLLLATGLWRAFGGLEKGATYYLHNPFFYAKLALFLLVLLLELWPMITLMQWRLALRGSRDVDVSRAPLFAKTSYVQLTLVILILFLATAIARGIGA